MKKLSLLLVTLFVLVGCSEAKLKPTSNELLFTINGKEIKEADVFEAMRLSSGSATILYSEAQKMLMKQIVEEDEVFDKIVQDILTEAKKLMGENFELTIKANGFDSEEAYVEGVIKDIARIQSAVAQAMDKNYESLSKKRPRKVRVLEVDIKDGKKVLELAKAGSDLKTLGEEYSEKSNYQGDEIIVSEISSLDTSILNKILAAEETGLLTEVVNGSKGDVAYIAEVVSVDTEALRAEAVDHFSKDNTLTNEYLAKLFKEHKFKIYDQDLHDAFMAQYSNFIK